MSNDLFAGIGVVPGTFLLPRPDANWTAWACVACDQYTSEPEYWQRVDTLPAPPERIDAIHAAMRDALNVLHPGVTDGFVLLERTTSTGKRLGLVCCVDLERYRYDGAKTLIRPTEETVASRLPARLAVRNGAPLESSHVMLLLDDPQRTVIEPLYARRGQLSPLYDFDLMQQSGTRLDGHVRRGQSRHRRRPKSPEGCSRRRPASLRRWRRQPLPRYREKILRAAQSDPSRRGSRRSPCSLRDG